MITATTTIMMMMRRRRILPQRQGCGINGGHGRRWSDNVAVAATADAVTVGNVCIGRCRCHGGE